MEKNRGFLRYKGENKKTKATSMGIPTNAHRKRKEHKRIWILNKSMKKIKEQQEIIRKAEEQVEIYLEMRGLLYRLKEITTGKKVVTKAPMKKRRYVAKKKKKKVPKAATKKVTTAINDSRKKKQPRKSNIVMPFVYEAMGYMP